ncbi:MAG TPA: MFS transporter [Candidatus Binataceae bacterium]|nr:MFS transporter [Candidatus Binataceae bacterium]
MAEQVAAGGKTERDPGSQSARAARPIVAAIVLLLIYQGYTLSVAGIASPWIARSFHLDQPALARLFAWMSVSAFGSMLLARLADHIGRRRIILASLILAPIFSLGSAMAPNPWEFAIFQVLISALLGGSVSSATVMLAEELPVDRRSTGQAFAAAASAIGGVLGYIVIPFLLKWGYSWQWLFAPSVAGIALVPSVARMLPKQNRWARVASTGSVEASHFYDIFHPLYRRRATTLLTCAAFDTMAGTAVNGWLYFEAVSILGLSPEKASMLVVLGMGVGMLGFPIGAWTAERFGRVPTVVYAGGAAWLGALAFYWEPSGVSYPFLWLAVAYCWFKILSGVMTVGANSAATELFPAALRTTMVGWQMITGAVFSMLAQALIAALIGPLGGLTIVVRYFAMLGIPTAIIFGLFIDETRGLPLDLAAREEEWARAQHRVYRPTTKPAGSAETQGA